MAPGIPFIHATISKNIYNTSQTQLINRINPIRIKNETVISLEFYLYFLIGNDINYSI